MDYRADRSHIDNCLVLDAKIDEVSERHLGTFHSRRTHCVSRNYIIFFVTLPHFFPN